MTRIGVRELKNQASRIVRDVREEKTEYVITHQGQPVAVLHPYTSEDADRERHVETAASLAAMKKTARDVAQAWVSSKNAVELVDEQRR